MKVVSELLYGSNRPDDILTAHGFLFAYFGSRSGVAKIDPATMQEVGFVSTTSTGGPYAKLTSNNTYVFCGVKGASDGVAQINPATMTSKIVYQSRAHSGIITANDSYVFVGYNLGVYRLAQDTLAEIDTYMPSLGTAAVQSLLSDQQYLYVVVPIVSSTQRAITKVDIATMQEVSVFNPGMTKGNWKDTVVSDGTYLYYGADGTPDFIYKIDPATMTAVSATPLESGENGTDLSCDGSFLYVITQAGSVIKFDVTTMERIETLNIGYQIGTGSETSVAADGQYVYVKTGTSPYRIIQIDPENESKPVEVLASIRFDASGATATNPDITRVLSATLNGSATLNTNSQKTAISKPGMKGAASFRATGLILNIPTGVYNIDADEVFSRNQPLRGEAIANYIEVYVNPLKPVAEAEEVYKSSEALTFAVGETKTITVYFEKEPVTEAAATLTEATENMKIIKETWYCWGGTVEIINNGINEGSCLITVSGKQLKVQGREVIVKKDETSILENGVKKYTFDNPFVQDRATAERIADKLLSYANAKRDITIDWRGNPALELADVVMIPEYQRQGLDQRGIFYVTKQELEFDGGLTAKLEGRKMDNG